MSTDETSTDRTGPDVGGARDGAADRVSGGASTSFAAAPPTSSTSSSSRPSTDPSSETPPSTAPSSVPARATTAPDVPLIPTRSADDSDTGWGERVESNDDRLLRDVPPHW